MYIGGLTNAVWWELLGDFLLFPRHPDHSTLLQHKPHSQCSPWQMPELTSLLEMLERGRLDEDEVLNAPVPLTRKEEILVFLVN